MSVKWWKLFGQKTTVGLALGGGSMRGVATVGVLKVLEKNHIPIHYISGTSAGSIAAAFWAAGKTAAEIEEIVLDLDWLRIARFSFALQGLLNPDKLQKYMEDTLPIKYFHETRIPLHISSSDLLSAREYVFGESQEEIALAVAASCSVPGVFTPTKYQDKYLVDGCLVNNLPFSSLARHRPHVYLGVSVIPRGTMPAEPKHLFQVISRIYDIYELNNFTRYQKYKPLILEPLKEYVSPEIKPGKDFYHKLIQAGATETERLLTQIQKAVS
ncbi:putative patatin [Candidatus Termititenax persephonae]|uniref:Patatin n=1 Tax=Candidatus Termititenax persephonae TaxID=2218525 RepID=A0A388TID2_9BACT|nr:putative patatin [Candidatus Termititenax persephonae]